jgi:hypothetical protein
VEDSTVSFFLDVGLIVFLLGFLMVLAGVFADLRNIEPNSFIGGLIIMVMGVCILGISCLFTTIGKLFS